MKITDLVPRTVFDALAPVGEALESLYQELEAQEYDNADTIMDTITVYLATHPSDLPIVEFACVDVVNERFPLTVTDDQFLGHIVKRYHETAKRQGTARRKATGVLAKATPAEIKTALEGYLGVPLAVDVNLCKILGTGEYVFLRGVTLCSEDEIHFPIGIKPYQDTWWMVHDKATGYLVRHGISDMQEAREILSNVMSVEDSTTLDGLGVWLSIMGAVSPPEDLGKLYKTISTSYVDKVTPIGDIIAVMAMYLDHTTITKPPQFRATSRKVTQTVLSRDAVPCPQIDAYRLVFRFEDGMSQRKKIDLRRSMVNRIAEQGIQDSLAIKPLEDAVQARYPMWLMLSDRAGITQTKAERVTEVSVAADIGMELANLRTVVQQQMRIAMDNKTSEKQKSGALARAVQASRAIMALRKEAGYFEANNATKAGIFKNMDSTVLQDDGAQFDKLIEQLAQQGDGDEN